MSPSRLFPTQDDSRSFINTTRVKPAINSKYNLALSNNEETKFENNDFTNHENIKVRKNFFPYQLMQMLASPSYADCVVWSRDGKAFIFLDRDKFITKWTRSSDKQKAFKKNSLTRRLNRWGFKQNTNQGHNYGMYSHALFQRDKPWLCFGMTCESTNPCKQVESSPQVKVPEARNKKSKYSHDEHTTHEQDETPPDPSIKITRTTTMVDISESRSLSEPGMCREIYLDNIRVIDRELMINRLLIEEKIQSLARKGMLHNGILNMLDFGMLW